MKKICFISKAANWQQYRLEVLTKLCKEYGYQVDILTTGELKDYLKENQYVKYYNFLSFLPLKWSLNLFPGSLLYIFKSRPDYVLALPNASNLTEFLALPLCKILNIPIVYWTHGYDHGKRKETIFNKIRVLVIEFFLRHADHIIAFSQKGKSYLIEKKINEPKITVAPNTLNTDFWFAKSDIYDKHILRKKYAYDNNSLVILFSGRLNKDKKVINLIKAMNLIQTKYKNFNIHVNIVGDGEEKTNLEKFVNDNNIKNINFYGFVFDEDKISELFSLSDLFVMPGYIGLAIVHAFCFALPVITENIDYHSPEVQYLKNGINGYFINEDDIEKLVEVLVSFEQNQEKLNKFSQAALVTAQNEASIHNMIKMMDEAFSACKQ